MAWCGEKTPMGAERRAMSGFGAQAGGSAVCCHRGMSGQGLLRGAWSSPGPQPCVLGGRGSELRRPQDGALSMLRGMERGGHGDVAQLGERSELRHGVVRACTLGVGGWGGGGGQWQRSERRADGSAGGLADWLVSWLEAGVQPKLPWPTCSICSIPGVSQGSPRRPGVGVGPGYLGPRRG